MEKRHARLTLSHFPFSLQVIIFEKMRNGTLDTEFSLCVDSYWKHLDTRPAGRWQ